MNIHQMISRSPLCLLALLGLTLFPSPVTAQVFDIVINVPADPDIGDDQSIGGDGLLTQLNVFDGGNVGDSFEALSGSEVNISGGTVGFPLDAFDDSQVNISGGILSRFNARSGSDVTISGGDLGAFSAFDGSDVTISGGDLGTFNAFDGSDVELVGGEFQLNGVAFSGSTFSLGEGDTFTGTLADGAVFISANGTPPVEDPNNIRFFESQPIDTLSGVQLTTVALPPLDLSPIVVSTSNPALPVGLRAGQTLTVLDGGVLEDDFKAVGATINVEGGFVGRDAHTANSIVNISGGTVDWFFLADNGSEINISGGIVNQNFDALGGSVVNISGGSFGRFSDAYDGSVVNISGGTVGISFEAYNGSVVNISGGSVGENFRALPESVVNISGGDVGDHFDAFSGSVVNITGGSIADSFDALGGSEVNISGGTFGNNFDVLDGSTLNLFGSDFVLDGGVSLDDSLTLDEAFTIEGRDVTLSGRLADGSAFSFELNSVDSFPNDFFSPAATLTVTLASSIPEVLLGDCNLDGVVNFSDISAFISVLQSGSFLEQADCNQDGEVNFGDIAAFIAILQGQ